ncbi:MAG TPA: ribosome biogenesis GTPase Der [Armatimonadota bacterium]
MPKPVIAIVGRPNVGKSTLFNRLIGERLAIVEDTPGVTRDRLYGTFDWRGRDYALIDTGGIVPDEPDPILLQTREQAQAAMDEADAILFLCDANDGLTAIDYDVAEALRKNSSKPIVLAVNKADGPRREQNTPEFYALGLGEVYPISSIQGHGVADMLDALHEAIPDTGGEEEYEEDVIRLAIIGRPNVGKSSLTNRILGEDRVIVSPIPGTTRDSIDTPFQRGDERYVLIDTAGIRRAGKIQGTIEYYTVLRAERAIERSDVVLLLVDAVEGVTDGDMRVGGMAQDAGKGCIIVVNKWDLIHGVQMHKYAQDVKDRIKFLEYAPVAFSSALTGRGIPGILDTVQTVAQNHALRIGTGELNRVIRQAVDAKPHTHKGRELKIRYATMHRVRPPTIALFCNNPQLVHFSYERYLTNCLRAEFGFLGTPIKLQFRRVEKEEK